MSQFNGMSEIELEMLEDEIRKVLPTLLKVAPTFAEVAAAYYLEFKKYDGIPEHSKVSLAVQSARSFIGGNQ